MCIRDSAISIDDEAPQIVSINKEEKPNEGGIVYGWVGPNIIIKASTHQLARAGKHIVKYWMVDPAAVSYTHLDVYKRHGMECIIILIMWAAPATTNGLTQMPFHGFGSKCTWLIPIM